MRIWNKKSYLYYFLLLCSCVETCFDDTLWWWHICVFAYVYVCVRLFTSASKYGTTNKIWCENKVLTILFWTHSSESYEQSSCWEITKPIRRIGKRIFGAVLMFYFSRSSHNAPVCQNELQKAHAVSTSLMHFATFCNITSSHCLEGSACIVSS